MVTVVYHIRPLALRTHVNNVLAKVIFFGTLCSKLSGLLSLAMSILARLDLSKIQFDQTHLTCPQLYQKGIKYLCIMVSVVKTCAIKFAKSSF